MIEQLPVLPLSALTIFPNTSISIEIDREICVNAINFALDNKLKIVVCRQIDAQTAKPSAEDVFSIGTLADISKILKVNESTYRILIDGLCVVDLVEFVPNDGFLIANVEERDNLGELNKTFILKTLSTLIEKYEKMYPKHIRTTIEKCDDANILINLVAGLISQDGYKQKLLSERDIKKKYELLCDMLAEELSYAEVSYNIEKKVREKINDSNKVFVLREQIKSMNNEMLQKNIMVIGKPVEDAYFAELAKLSLSPEAVSEVASKIKIFNTITTIITLFFNITPPPALFNREKICLFSNYSIKLSE